MLAFGLATAVGLAAAERYAAFAILVHRAHERPLAELRFAGVVEFDKAILQHRSGNLNDARVTLSSLQTMLQALR